MSAENYQGSGRQGQGGPMEFPMGGSSRPAGVTRKFLWIGCLLPVALLIAFIAAFLYHPDDQPASVSVDSSQLIGRWKSAGGGKLVLRSNGTFSAQNSCGFGSEAAPGSASGTWVVAQSGDWGRGMGVQFVFDKTYIWLGVSKEKGTLVLWRHIGDPDEGDYCKVRKGE